MSPLLSIREATKVFGGLTAVDRVTFGVYPGETLGLIGPNGSGKTTLISLISGTHTMSSGDIVFKGRSIRGLPPYRRARLGVARTFQVVKPLQDMTVRENVMAAMLFGHSNPGPASEILTSLAGRPVREAYAAAEEVLAEVGLLTRQHDDAEKLTIADRKRLEVARALALRPELLLLDEVMAGLNHTEVAQAMEMIRNIARRGVTILVVEHVMKAIMGLSDRIVVLHHGAVIAEGLPRDVVKDPEVVRAYLGQRFAAGTGEGK